MASVPKLVRLAVQSAGRAPEEPWFLLGWNHICFDHRMGVFTKSNNLSEKIQIPRVRMVFLMPTFDMSQTFESWRIHQHRKRWKRSAPSPPMSCCEIPKKNCAMTWRVSFQFWTEAFHVMIYIPNGVHFMVGPFFAIERWTPIGDGLWRFLWSRFLTSSVKGSRNSNGLWLLYRFSQSSFYSHNFKGKLR